VITVDKLGCGDHVWGAERRHEAHGGPLDGVWLVAECQHCNAGTLRPEGGGDGYNLFIEALRQRGCWDDE
jgi:hypothetical protein